MNEALTRLSGVILGSLMIWTSVSCTQPQPSDPLVPAALQEVEVRRFYVKGEEYVQAKLDEVITAYRVAPNAPPDMPSQPDPTERQWIEQLNRPHPSVATLERMFEEAADEFGVPVDLLKAVAQVESNWTQVGPSVDHGYGIMHLVANSYSNTLKEAAALIDCDVGSLKSDARQNIRAGAALLAAYAGAGRESFELTDWVAPLMRFSGLIDDQTRRMQAKEYLRVLRMGNASITLWKEAIALPPHDVPAIDIELELLAAADKTPRASVDYAGAVATFTTCNYYSGRGGYDINAWVNHYIGTGTIAGAISWFKNCSANASAHFIIDRTGKIYQMVKVKDGAWHCGASGYPANNRRSIGVEHDATAANPSTWNDTRMLKASANMARYFCDREGIPKVHRSKGSTAAGIYGHKEMPGCSTACPGPLPWDTWMGYLNGGSSTGRLIGVVYEDKGNDDMSTRIGGAKVTLSTGASVTASSDDALWEFNVAPGTYTVQASASGYASNSRSCTVTAGADTWCSIGLKSSTSVGALKGVVYVDKGNDDMSERIPGAKVKLSSGASTTARDSDAFWSFSVAPGDYSVEVSADGYDTKSRTCSVTAGGETWCSVGLPKTVACTPDCAGRACGADPVCGQSCGTCADGHECNSSGQCECNPDCSTMECGVDPVCGTSCGSCGQDETCEEGVCIAQGLCVPDCESQQCGADPSCGLSCGICAADQVCSDAGTCGDIADDKGKVYGYVLKIDASLSDDTGEPLANAQVIFKDDPNDSGLQIIADENGYFELQVAPGEYEITSTNACCEMGVAVCTVAAQQAEQCNVLLLSSDSLPGAGSEDGTDESITVSVGCMSTSSGLPGRLGVLIPMLVLIGARWRKRSRRISM